MSLTRWRSTSRARIGPLLAIALLLQSCDSPRPALPSEPTPTTPRRVVRVEVTAPTEIAPDASVQLAAIAVRSDGSTENVTNLARWNSSNSGVLSVSATGVATAGRRGEAQIMAGFEFTSGSARVMVLPSGTYRLSGQVAENGFGVRDVTLTVISGIGEGLATRTGASGDYILYGVSGAIRLVAAGEGYLDAIQDLDVRAHSTHQVEIQAAQPIESLVGTYTLTLTAGCRSGAGTLPESARRRTYLATVTQERRVLDVSLSGAEFLLHEGRGNHFAGLVDATGSVTFEIGNVGYDYYYSPRCVRCDLVERFSPTTALVIGGNVAAERAASEIAGVLFGTFWLADGTTAPLTRFPNYCTGVHDFIMRRQ
jgi:hypothetical protein